MKAVVIHATGGPEQLALAELSDPVPGLGDGPAGQRRLVSVLVG